MHQPPSHAYCACAEKRCASAFQNPNHHPSTNTTLIRFNGFSSVATAENRSTVTKSMYKRHTSLCLYVCIWYTYTQYIACTQMRVRKLFQQHMVWRQWSKRKTHKHRCQSKGIIARENVLCCVRSQIVCRESSHSVAPDQKTRRCGFCLLVSFCVFFCWLTVGSRCGNSLASRVHTSTQFSQPYNNQAP